MAGESNGLNGDMVSEQVWLIGHDGTELGVKR
jgi:hypothetical protein